MTLETQITAEDWHEIDLGELATFRTGPFGSTFHKSDYVVGGTPLINPSHIVDGDIVPDETVTVRPELAKRLSVFALREGEIVIGRRGDMGRCAVVKRRHEGFLCGTGSMIVRPRPGINPHLLQALLSSPEIIAKIEENSVGTTMINLNQGTLASLNIRMATDPLEQEAIAEALSDADALIEGLERLIAKKRLIKQGAMQDLLTAKRRLPGFSGEWTFSRVGSKVRMQVGFPFPSSGFAKQEVGPRLIRNRDLRSHSDLIYFSGDYSDAYLVRPGEVLIGMDGDFAPTIWSGGLALLNQRVGRLVPLGENDIAFFQYRLQSELSRIEAETSGTTVKHLSHGDVENTQIPIPKPEEQAAISNALLDMDAEIQALEIRLGKARAVKEGMMQNLLTGRIRLV